MTHTHALTAGLAAAAVVLAGCGSNGMSSTMPGMEAPTNTASTPSNAAPAPHNDADVAFAQGMIPHHAQAIDMARMAADRAQSDQVKNLARRIEAAQGPEIATMTGWLNSWGAPTTPPGMHHTTGDGGMMSPEEMRQFHNASGADFDRMFLTMMIKHHEGAITMAQSELRDGQYPPAKQLAQQIIDAQRAEIDTMKGIRP